MSMSDELSNKIIKRIETEQIEAIPRWRFLFWRGLFWLFAFVSIIIGSLAVGAILFLIADHYLKNILVVPHDITEFLLMIPYLWFVVFVLFLVIARTSVKHTKGGYRHSLRRIVLVSIVLSAIFGTIFYLVGISEITHKFLNNNVPLYNFVTRDSDDALEFHLKETSTSTRTNR